MKTLAIVDLKSALIEEDMVRVQNNNTIVKEIVETLETK